MSALSLVIIYKTFLNPLFLLLLFSKEHSFSFNNFDLQKLVK